MKKVLIFIFLFSFVPIYSIFISSCADVSGKTPFFEKAKHGKLSDATYNIPEPTGWVNDHENIFTEPQKKYLDSLIAAFEKQTTNEIAIITVDSSMTSENNFDDYILHVAQTWKVGKAGKNNGSLIGISRSFQRIHIENGDGITEKLSNAQSQQIVDSVFIAHFRQGEFFEGTKQGVLTMMEKLK